MSVRKIFHKVIKHIPIFTAGVIFAVLCFIGLNAAMEPASKSQFCGGTCHEMKTAYTTWELSVHGANKYGFSVECIYCHLPPKDKYFAHVATKAYEGAKDVFMHLFIGGYDVEESLQEVIENMRDETCVHCHNNLLVKPGSSAARFAHTASLDQPNSEETRCLACHEEVGHQRNSKLFSP